MIGLGELLKQNATSDLICEKCGLVYFRDVKQCNGSYEGGICKGRIIRTERVRARDRADIIKAGAKYLCQ